MATTNREGSLIVTLKNARGLKNVEAVGAQDPYCVLSCAGQKHRSKTHTDGGITPYWNETFTFPNVSSDVTLKIEIYDENMVFRDKVIGICNVPLQQVSTSCTEDITAPVMTNKGKKQEGEVLLKLVFKAYEQAPCAAAQAAAVAQTSSTPAAEPVIESVPSGRKGWVLAAYGGTDCWAEYERGWALGEGAFATTYLAKRKGTREQYAVKVISKRKLSTPEQVEDVQREVQILHHLAGHPNVVQVKAVFEDKHDICIVMDVCDGGELFDAIVKRGSYSEKDAAALIRVIVGIVVHCHAMGVIHRDIKPENFLLSDSSPNAELKAIDFGLSTFLEADKVYTDMVGSAYYVAPEVLRRAYSKEADIWSCGVILYILLCGYPPFQGSSEKKIFNQILKKPLDFTSEPWPQISEPAKDCIRRMLERDPKLRATDKEILQHEWMRENGVATDTAIEVEVLGRIKTFSAGNKLKKQAMKVIASNLPADEISAMREMFLSLDTDGSGCISVTELAEALRKKGNHLPEEEVQAIIASAVANGNDRIDYEEFLAATICQSKLHLEDNLKAAFEHFDKDGDGTITADELVQSLEKMGINNDGIQQILAEVDKDGDGVIDYNEFCLMMRDL